MRDSESLDSVVSEDRVTTRYAACLPGLVIGRAITDRFPIGSDPLESRDRMGTDFGSV